MNREETEEIILAINTLRESSKEMPIVVEGKNDERALRSLGIEGKIFKLAGSSLFEICDAISDSCREIMLFVDADREGRKIGKAMAKYLMPRGVKINAKLANRLLKMLNAAEVEDLPKRIDEKQILYI